MPVYLNTLDIYSELSGVKSVLIVPCRICPAISLAVANGEPYIELFRRLFRTASLDRYVRSVQARLEKGRVKTGVFESFFPIPMMCMWTSWQRKRLLKCAASYEAVVVMGCDSATHTVRESVQSTDCQVFQGMKVEGIVSVTPRFHLPLNITLEISSKRCVSWPDL